MKIQLKQFDVLQSTNVTAVAFAKEGAPEGTVIVAERQEGGRGRMHRVWSSPKGGLWFTIILRPQIDPQFVAQVTLLAGVAVVRALRKLYATEEIMIKWPNDLLLNGKKVCGILSEMQLNENGSIDYAIVGIGVNVDLNPQAFPEDLRNTAASLNASFGKNYTCTAVLDNILQEFASLYRDWLKEGAQVILEPWKKLNCTLNRRVFVKDNDEVIFSGEVVAINEAGAIIVRNEEGESQSFDFGEISIRY
ncbi:MAG: biotin--[acetyl-CoA-carboxylase] ligase [Phascolarctobacterium sp.]|nr:biotin--[acetyl-CoA-carboxylase] ligase [Phascolarctobacterium sp.]